jgi:methylamine dehydrogenase heavy chain
MRVIVLVTSCLLLWAPHTWSQIAPEQVGTATLPEPGENWIAGITRMGAYIYDADTGDMQGLISLSGYTSGFEVDRVRRQVYAPEMYYSRGVHGERTDVVTIYDFDNLSPVAEIEVPQKIAVLRFRRHVGMLGDNRHFLVFNMTPAQSVTVVDVEDREFVGEISTPGCAMIMPVAERDFLMICSDGTLQLIQLDEQGAETNRERSKKIFEVLEDPIFDRPVPTATGWLVYTHAGKAFHVTVDGDDIEIGDEWALQGEDEDDQAWRPGGGEFATVHKATGLMYMLMHKPEEDYTHDEPGTEIWVIDINAQRRLERIELETPAYSVYVTQSAEPKLVVSDEEGGLHIFDAIKLSLDHTIEDPGPGAAYFRAF